MKPKTVSVKTMRESDAYTIAHFVPSKELMRRAGEAIFRAASWVPPVAVVCGKGNNAGDGFVVASYLREAGIDCTIFLLSDEFSEDGAYFYKKAVAAGAAVVQYTEGTDFSAYGSVLDCLFGTGFRGEAAEPFAGAIRAINASGAYVVSADINSGLNGDTGLGEPFVISDLTVSIGAFKHGHFRGYADRAMKQKINCDIGIRILPDLEGDKP